MAAAATMRPAPAPAATVRTPARTVGAARPSRLPLRGLTVLYDPRCGLCSFIGGWLRGQRQLVPITLVPVGSTRARTWFPALDHDGATRREITVVGDMGQVWTGDAAWVVCLWALAEHRAFSHTLATPAGRKLARAAVLSASKYRAATARRQQGRRERQPYDPFGIPFRVPAPGTAPRGAPLAGVRAAAAPGTCADGCPPPH